MSPVSVFLKVPLVVLGHLGLPDIQQSMFVFFLLQSDLRCRMMIMILHLCSIECLYYSASCLAKTVFFPPCLTETVSVLVQVT